MDDDDFLEDPYFDDGLDFYDEDELLDDDFDDDIDLPIGSTGEWYY